MIRRREKTPSAVEDNYGRRVFFRILRYFGNLLLNSRVVVCIKSVGVRGRELVAFGEALA